MRGCTRNALKLALLYLVFGVLWIALSDRVVALLGVDREIEQEIQTWKGWGYVAITSALLFLLARRDLLRVEREAAEHERIAAVLVETEEVQRHLLASLDDIVWLMDLESGRLLFISAAVERIYGAPVAAFLKQPELWLQAVYPVDRHLAEGKAKTLETNGAADIEYRIVRTDGGLRWIRDRTRVLRNAEGKACSLIGIGTDVTAQHQNAEDIYRLSNYDMLTGLPNRGMLEQLLHKALEQARPAGRRVGVLCTDISRLKDINTTFGHGSGDEVLRRFAERLKTTAGHGAIVARLGAAEFAVVLPDLADGALAGVAAQKLLEAMAAPMSLSIGEMRIGAVVGVSVFPLDAEAPAELLKHADLALRDAKQRGPGHMSLYQPSMNAVVAERVALLADLHLALERNELELFYQPQIDLGSGRAVAVEALLRWRHPVLGLVPPSRFIPIAEESGLIVAIGAWVLREACRQNRAWQQTGLPTIVMAVNISAVQFRETSLRETVARALADGGLDPGCLELEVTESVIMDSAERMLDMLAGFRELGVQLSIDDFGTGYSSLAYLTRFAVHKLKIDQVFVGGALQHGRDATIVGTIIQMAKALHMRVIAEGVETEAQAAMLRRQGCDEAQGYLFSRPLPAAECADFLRRNSAAAQLM